MSTANIKAAHTMSSPKHQNNQFAEALGHQQQTIIRPEPSFALKKMNRQGIDSKIVQTFPNGIDRQGCFATAPWGCVLQIRGHD